MKKSEVIAKLEAIPGDPEVWVSSDEEGNSFDTVGWVQEEKMFGIKQGYDRYDTSPVAKEDIGTEYDEDDLVTVVMIWP